MTTDLHEFEHLLQIAAGTADPAERVALLERAVGLYRGEPVAGCYDEWAVQEQARWSARHADALQEWSAYLEQAGQREAAMDAAQRALRADPYREETYQRLMRLYAGLGRATAALELYRELERLLRSELGLSPAVATRELAEQLRRDPRRVVTTATTPHTAQTAEQPRTAAKEPPAPPQPAAAPSHPALPLQLTRFFGREEELAGLERMLRGEIGGSRLITLTGPGGAGKTRLAIETAQRVAPAFAGRVWFVELAGLPDPGLLPYAVRSALKLPPLSGANPLDEAVEFFGEEPGLLVLDNFEHLLRDADRGSKSENPAAAGGGAAIVRFLLERAPALACLVTSRQPLRLGGEREVSVSPLAVPAGAATLQDLLECASVALYTDRAQSAKADFALTANNADAVAALCRKLEGMPLAIEMAAAWARTLPPSRMLERLERQLALLVSRRRDLPPRHQSLRATIEWSYDLLSAELRVCFARLSVFRGGWTLEAAEAVCACGASVESEVLSVK